MALSDHVSFAHTRAVQGLSLDGAKAMIRKASALTGERLIAAETALETAFAKGGVVEAALRGLLARAESARVEL